MTAFGHPLPEDVADGYAAMLVRHFRNIWAAAPESDIPDKKLYFVVPNITVKGLPAGMVGLVTVEWLPEKEVVQIPKRPYK